jgi:hypothetical protein
MPTRAADSQRRPSRRAMSLARASGPAVRADARGRVPTHAVDGQRLLVSRAMSSSCTDAMVHSPYTPAVHRRGLQLLEAAKLRVRPFVPGACACACEKRARHSAPPSNAVHIAPHTARPESASTKTRRDRTTPSHHGLRQQSTGQHTSSASTRQEARAHTFTHTHTMAGPGTLTPPRPHTRTHTHTGEPLAHRQPSGCQRAHGEHRGAHVRSRRAEAAPTPLASYKPAHMRALAARGSPVAPFAQLERITRPLEPSSSAGETPWRRGLRAVTALAAQHARSRRSRGAAREQPLLWQRSTPAVGVAILLPQQEVWLLRSRSQRAALGDNAQSRGMPQPAISFTHHTLAPAAAPLPADAALRAT